MEIQVLSVMAVSTNLTTQTLSYTQLKSIVHPQLGRLQSVCERLLNG